MCASWTTGSSPRSSRAGRRISSQTMAASEVVLKKKVYVGNFVEVKNATMGEGAKAGHLAYIGDAELKGDNNIGCGVIFVNYDGKNKHRSVVEKGAFIGSNANIVAPVHIGEDAYIAAGSTITKDVEKKALALERSEQKIVMDWVERKR